MRQFAAFLFQSAAHILSTMGALVLLFLAACSPGDGLTEQSPIPATTPAVTCTGPSCCNFSLTGVVAGYGSADCSVMLTPQKHVTLLLGPVVTVDFELQRFGPGDHANTTLDLETWPTALAVHLDNTKPDCLVWQGSITTGPLADNAFVLSVDATCAAKNWMMSGTVSR